MKEDIRSIQPPQGSRLECREDQGQLMLHLPARPDRGLFKIAGLIALVAGVWIAAFFYARAAGLTLLPPFLGVLGFIVLLLSVIYFGALHWTDTSVLVTPKHYVVKTVFLGKEDIEQHEITEKSQAWRLTGKNMAGRYRDTGGGSVMQWIEIGTQGGESRFGYGLSKEEADWVVSRINQYLGRPIDHEAPHPHG